MTGSRSIQRTLALGYGLTVCASCGRVAPIPDPSSTLIISVGAAQIEMAMQHDFPDGSGQGEGWLGYALARRTWIDTKFRARFPKESEYSYTFEEELDARETAAKIWGELNEKEPLKDPYFGDLQKVVLAGYFREYVWYCVPHPTWKPVAGLRQKAFGQWLLARLPNHRVETWVTVAPTGFNWRVIMGVEAHQATTCRVPIDEKVASSPNPAKTVVPGG